MIQTEITQKQRKSFKGDCTKFLSSMVSTLVQRSPLNYKIIAAISAQVMLMLKRNLKIKSKFFMKEIGSSVDIEVIGTVFIFIFFYIKDILSI